MSMNSLASDQADDPVLFKSLIQKPHIAWPTITLLVAAYVIFGSSTLAFFEDVLSLGWVILINSIAAYISFTVAHDATHSAVSSNRRLNDWVGRAGTSLLEPGPFFLLFRFIHMQHHRFTNDPAKDPDAYSGKGPKWLLPVKWLTMDLIYFKYYTNPASFKKRPKSERREFYLVALFSVIVIAAFAIAGWLEHYLLLFFIPTRIAKFFIIFAFDFLPHHPHEITAKKEPFQCTSNRVGLEWLLTPIFIYQNYHLVHHLYPAVPFYRYLKIWNARKGYHESQNPAITDAFSLSPRES